MRVKETNLGNGLSRLEVEPMCANEVNMPTSVLDEIMRDIIRRKNNRNESRSECGHRVCGCHTEIPRFSRPIATSSVVAHEPMREPDGIDVHVDRPTSDKFRNAHQFFVAMDKYRNLERAAKACDWECREPMRGLCEPCFDDEPCFEDDFEDELDEELVESFGIDFGEIVRFMHRF